MIDPVLGGENESLIHSLIGGAPGGVTLSVRSLVRNPSGRDIGGGDQLHPRPIDQPAYICLVGGENGFIAHVPQIAPQGDHLILDATPGATGEKLPDGDGGSAVTGLREIVGGRVMNRNAPHAVDLVDPIAAVAQS